MARKSGYVRRNGVMRRESLWFTGVMTLTTLGAPSTAVLVTTLNAAALALRPFTVVRTRGTWQVISDNSTVAESYQVQLGHAVVSDQASAIGITAVSTPATDSGSDLWYVFETQMGSLEVTTDVGRYIKERSVNFDSKAMRKVEDGEDLITVLETSAISLGASVRLFSRTLIKLH